MKIQFTLLFCFITFTTLSSQTTLSGSLTDEKTGEPLLFATVSVYQNGNLITGTQTDFDGEYYLENLETTNYDIVFSYVGYEKIEVTDVRLEAGKVNYLDGNLTQGTTLETVVIVAYESNKRICRRGCCGCTIRKDEEPVPATEIKATIKYPELKVYPNPASSHFTIKSEREINDASIFNISGQLVKTLSKGQTEVDVSNLLPGTYFLVITEGEIVQTKKIVIVRN